MKYSLSCFPCFVNDSKTQPTGRESSLPEGICRQFSLAEIKAATNNLGENLIVGYCAFGPVYRGTINTSDGSMVVAIKCHYRSYSIQESKTLQKEVQLLCQIRHPNVISLIGFCDEQNKLFAVYEFTKNGSLSDHLYGFESYVPISWKQRLQICIGAARGLHYLHTGAKYAVIHHDIKTSSILLNQDWACKLSGFWTSRRGPMSMSKSPIVKQESFINGTYRFMAPEYVMYGEFTDKSDVFSFGMVLLEVLCGIHVIDLFRRELAEIKAIYDFIDPRLNGEIAPECLEKYLEIACSCIQVEGNKRPAMGEVEVTLELALELQNGADSKTEGSNPHGECRKEVAAIGVYISNILDNLKNHYGKFLPDLANLALDSAPLKLDKNLPMKTRSTN